jgi:hypothetical protein
MSGILQEEPKKILLLSATLNGHKVAHFKLQWYQAVRISEEVQTLSERTTLLRYSTSCCATKLHVPD